MPEAMDADFEPHFPDVAVRQLAVHDLKGAVHAIQGFISVLRTEQAGPLTPTQRDFLTSAFVTARRLERLVEDLQVVEFGNRALSLVISDCDLLAIAQMCVRELEPTATGFDVSVVIDADEMRDWSLRADGIRLEQIIFNLVENAIRYSPPGAQVRVRLEASRSRLLLVVENPATDADAVDLRRAFRPFQRGKHTGEPQRRGLGIGLTVVQTLAAAHGWKLVARGRDEAVAIAVSLRRREPASQPAMAAD